MNFQVSSLAWPHTMLGVGLGGTDAALVPALLARSPNNVHHLAALLQASSSAAYAIGEFKSLQNLEIKHLRFTFYNV